MWRAEGAKVLVGVEGSGVIVVVVVVVVVVLVVVVGRIYGCLR